MKLHPWIAAAAIVLSAGTLFAQTPAASPPAAAASPAPSAVVPKNVIPDIKARGKLVVGVKYNVPLFGQNNPITKRVEGLDADLARAFAKALLGSEDKVELVEAISANRVPFLQEDKVDLVISTMTITDDRKKQIDMSDVYYLAGQRLLVPKGSPIKTVADLAGKTVATAQGSTSEKQLMEQAPTCKPLLFKGYSECFEALKNGQADAMTTDDAILYGFVATAPDKYEVVGPQFSSEPYGVGIKKGKPDLTAFVNSELAKMKTDGRWKAMYDKNIKPVSKVSIDPPK
jgi:putative glutamine transport system substrate-binding protein